MNIIILLALCSAPTASPSRHNEDDGWIAIPKLVVSQYGVGPLKLAMTVNEPSLKKMFPGYRVKVSPNRVEDKIDGNVFELLWRESRVVTMLQPKNGHLQNIEIWTPRAVFPPNMSRRPGNLLFKPRSQNLKLKCKHGPEMESFFYCKAPDDPFFYIGQDQDISHAPRQDAGASSGDRRYDHQPVDAYTVVDQYLADLEKAPADFVDTTKISAIGIGHPQD